ncbi:MAG: TIGR02757 family protein [Bacteroidales bacterium]
MPTLLELAHKYNHIDYFKSDPVIFPRHFKELWQKGEASLMDIEISGILCAHLAWGRREMIVRDCRILMDEMEWRPFHYVMAGNYRDDNRSLHRTIKWSEISIIQSNLREYYSQNSSLENLKPEEYRVCIFGRKMNPKAANKKIHMFRRWMVRDDGKVDLGVWKKTSPESLIIPLDVHVHRMALELGITQRKSSDITTALEITSYLKTIFPGDPCLGDFALFAYSASQKK